MRVDQSVETRQTRRTGIVDADMVQVGMGLLGRQRGHGGLRKMASSILDAFSGNTGSAVRHIGPGVCLTVPIPPRGAPPWLQAIVAYLHYLSIFLLFALLVLQHRPLRLPLDLSAPAAWRRSTAATALRPGGTGQRAGAGAVVRQGPRLLLHNGLFHAKVGLFVLAALVSLLPTVTFLGWRGALQAAGEVPA